jgi:RNA polymerase sigma factor for flagellar operon FliA
MRVACAHRRCGRPRPDRVVTYAPVRARGENSLIRIPGYRIQGRVERESVPTTSSRDDSALGEERMESAAGVTPGRSRNRRPDTSTIEVLWQAYWLEPGDEHRNALVEAYQHLVQRVVRRFSARLPRMVDRGDLDTAGNVGLMAAIGSYDPSRRVRFEAYAEMRIRGALLDELRSEDWLPRPWRQRIELQKRVLEGLRAELSREPYDEEVALAMDLPLGDYELLFGTGLPGAPGGSMPGGEEDDEQTSGLEVVADTKQAPPGDQLTRAELLRLVAQRMTEQEYRIVYLKYWEELPMREIGLLTGLSESRVCKIHSRLMERLKDRFRVGAAEEV